MSERYLSVAVDAPLNYTLTYKTNLDCAFGTSVIVPLGKRTASAVVLSETSPDAKYTIKNINSIDTTRPQISEPYMRWLKWLSDYYVHPIGQVLALPFPPLQDKKSSRVSKKKSPVPQPLRSNAKVLTEEQQKCVDNISQSTQFDVHLVHGVTGSGKTEVYLQLLDAILKKNQRGLVLVPEISLTPQLIERFAARFGDQIAVLHSHLTDRERTNQWWSVVDKEKKILIGARSALFCPIEDLGLIIVDEEHEPSYKQEEKLRYHARDSAIVLAKILNVPIVLGSATPSLESWSHAQTGRYHLHSMTKRVADRALPTVEVIDMRTERTSRKEHGESALPFWLSDRLYKELIKTLERREQAALFLNRRGVSPVVLCGDCGFIHKCPNCEISLTLHGSHNLVCHYCDYAIPATAHCPSCKVGELKNQGIGTEQIEEDIKKLFPDSRVARADRDEIHSRETLEQLISQMENHEIDILIGTQMIAKGLDFEKLTFVGHVLADIGFNMPDFRAAERSFQLLTQVSGRAGRHLSSGGQVLIQTFNVEHSSLRFALTADYASFAEHELQFRKELNYPPYGRLAVLRLVAKNTSLGESTSELVAERAQSLIKKNENYKKISVLGPTVAPLAKLRGKYRYHLLLKTQAPSHLSSFIRQLIGDGSWIPSGTKIQIDIDPLNLL